MMTVFALAHGGTAMAQGTLPAFPSAAVGDYALLVELVVNSRATGDIISLRTVADQMLVATDALRRNGLPVAGAGDIDVAHMPGVIARYDAAAQTLAVDMSPDLMPVGHVEGEQRLRAQTVADWGAMLNYDAYAQRSAKQTSAALWTEQRIFGPIGIFSNTGTARIASGKGSRTGYVRFDTRIRHVDEQRAIAYTVGDLITQSLPWTTSVRMGGIQIARDYRVRPDLLTVPLPSFAGKTAIPSAVDLFIDGYRQQQADVAPGRFVLDNIPVVNGAGQATIVTTDATGREIATTIPFYVSSTLLKPGLLDMAAEIGFLRRAYALRSFDYDTLSASLSARRGLSSWLTLEAHGEASSSLRLAGVGAVLVPWRLGTFDASTSASRTGGASGLRWSVGYNYSSRRFSVAYQHEEQGRAFRDLGSFDLVNYAGSRRSDRFIASVNIRRQGSFAMAYISGTSLDDRRARIATMSYSRPLGRTANLFVSADHDFVRNASSAQLRLAVPFGRNVVGGGISHSPDRGSVAQLDYSHTMPSSGGLGFDASLASDDHGNAYGQSTLTWRSRAMQSQAGGAFAQGRSSVWLGASGAIVTMQSGVYAANQISDAFAVVSTDGVKGVKVTYENQPVGMTDRGGMLFIPNVNSYLPTRFAIDSLSMPIDQVASTVEQRVAFRQGTGAVVRMPVRRVRNISVVLIDRSGQPIAPGGLVTRKAAADTVTGWDGLVYLEDVSDRMDLTIVRQNGATCRAAVAVPAGTQAFATIGPFPCL